MKKILLSLATVALAAGVYAEDNLLTNASFEVWTDGYPTGWKSTTSASSKNAVSQSSDAHTGSSSVLLAYGTSNKRLAYNEMTLKAGKYILSFYAKSVSADSVAQASIGYLPITNGNPGNYVYSSKPVDLPTTWTLVSDTFDITVDTLNIVFGAKKGRSLIDDASLVLLELKKEDDGQVDMSGVISIAEAQAAAASTKVKVYGTVVATSARGAVIGDETGYIYYYNASSTLKIGDEVLVEDAVSSYGGFNQLTSKATVKTIATGQAVTYPTAVAMDGAAMDAWMNDPKIQYVSITGDLSVNGSYYNVKVEGATTAIGSLVYPTDAVKANLANGTNVTIKGFAMYPSSSKYVNIIVVEAKANTAASLKHITNTLETAYTTAEAIKLIDDKENDLSDSVYVKGIISKIQGFNSSYGEITYWLDNDSFEVYNGLGLNGAKFTKESDLSMGDTVVIKGTLSLYEKDTIKTYELNSANFIVKYNPTSNVIVPVVKNTPETAYTTAEIIKMIDDKSYNGVDTIYVKGIVSKVDTILNQSKITYWLDNDSFEIYSGYGVEKEKMADKSYLPIGAEVIVRGVAMKYNSTYEMKSNNILYSVDGRTVAGIKPVAAEVKRNQIFNLLGQPVADMTKRGVYIVNGKKVIVK